MENCNAGLAGFHLDIRFYVPEGLTEAQRKALDKELQDAMAEYGKERADYSDMNYYKILESAADRLGIKYEYPKVDYTIYV